MAKCLILLPSHLHQNQVNKKIYLIMLVIRKKRSLSMNIKILFKMLGILSFKKKEKKKKWMKINLGITNYNLRRVKLIILLDQVIILMIKIFFH